MKTPTKLQGYQAASKRIKKAMRAASDAAPKRRGGREHLAAYREGYWSGLVIAYALLSYGEFPAHNAEAINETLSKP